jgi:hypothetical protein
LDKEKEGVFSRKAVAGDTQLAGKPAVGSTTFLDRSRSPSKSFDMPDRSANPPPASGGNGNETPVSPSGRARLLPRKAWIIAGAALAGWAIVLIVGYIILG